MSKSVSWVRALSLLAGIAVTGCEFPPGGKIGDFLRPGEYDGFYIKREAGRSEQGFFGGMVKADETPAPRPEPREGEQPQAPTPVVVVSGEFTDGAQKNFKVEIARTQDKKVFQLTLTGLTDLVIKIQSKRLDSCFPIVEGTPIKGRLCVNGDGALIEYQNAQGDGMVIGFDPRDATRPGDTTPAIYTLSKVIDTAMAQSFDSRIQYEASVSSRETAKAARLNLLPHFRAADALSFALHPSKSAVIGLIGDLAPFLFPSNWYGAIASSRQSDVDEFAYRITKSDAGNTAEGLAYSLLRDQRSLKILQTYVEPITRLRDQLIQGELVRVQESGTADSLTAVLLSLEETRVTYETAIRGDKRALAQAMGFRNPDAVTDVEVGELPSLENPIVPARDSARRIALDLSLELRQAHALADKALKELRGRQFDWINPQGGTPIGAGLPATILAGQASVRQMAEQRSKVEASLLQKVDAAFDTIEVSATRYSVAQRNLALQLAQVTRHGNSVFLGQSISGLALRTALQSAMESEITKIDAECSYYVAVANLNRLLYIGAYSQYQWSSR